MSKKNYDNHNRWRNKTVAFRVSAEEDLQLETLVKLTGLTKQDYIIRRLLRCGGAGQSKSLQSPAGSVVCCAGRAAPDRGRTGRERRAAGYYPNDHNHYERDAGGIRL